MIMTESTKAKIEDIRELGKRIKDNWSLCELFDGTPRACEAEMMVAQTIHACVINLDSRGEAFSFRGDGVFGRGGGGLVDNDTAYGRLVDEHYFAEEKRGDKTVIFVTQKLVDFLNRYFADKGEPATLSK